MKFCYDMIVFLKHISLAVLHYFSFVQFSCMALDTPETRVYDVM